MRASAGFRLEGVSVAYAGKPALAEVTLAIEPGEAVALVGPSGAGKTTLLGLLNGTRSATAGTVRVDETALETIGGRALRELRATLGFVPQDLALVPNLRVVHNVLAGRLGSMSLLGSLRSMCMPSKAETRAVYEILERVGIESKLYERTDTLSGGQQQRVAIARALYQGPRALLADEPISSVDPARGRDTIQLMLALCRERGLTLVVSLHDIAIAQECFPRLVGLRHGRVVFDARPEDIDRSQLDELYRLTARDLDNG